MKNIGIDLRVLNRLHTGIERYSYNLAVQISRFNEEEYYFIGGIESNYIKKKNRISVDLPQSNNFLSEKLLSLIGEMNNLDLVHSPYFPIPKYRTFKGILTIHDIIPLKEPGFFANKNNYDFFNIAIRESVKYIDHIIADSECTKDDIINLLDVNEDKITVVHLAADKVSSNTLSKLKHHKVNVLKKYNINTDYILSVCTIEPRKNIQRTLKSYEIFRERHKEKINLVLVGKLGWKYESLIQAIKESKFSDDIILTGYVPDEDLPILYKNSEVFIYPSLYEGFGLPVLEAMTCGTPVITSNVSSLPEVGGDSVMYCNPYDIESIVYALEEVVTKPSLQNKLKEKGKDRSKQFSWRKTAEQTRQVYLNCLK